jgi:hypothetical protein
VIILLAALLSTPLGTVHGTVVSAETGDPLAFSIVSLRPTLNEHFTDEHGAFTFAGVLPGTYRLVVRQIGYTPADTTLVVTSDADVVVHIVLIHVAVELPPITVTGELTCTQPGLPDAASTPALSAVFEQLLENARRYRLLADSFPFTFVIERRYESEVDTVTQTSAQEHRYRPGRVIDWGKGDFRNQRVVLLPALQEFADSAFLQNHCFRLAGRDTLEGETFVRVDFEPAARLRSPDVAGAAYLEEGTYQLRYTRVSLTRAERSLPGVIGLVATTRFREIVPGIVLHDRVRAVTTLRRVPERVEEQRLLAVQFMRPFGTP